MEVQVKDGDIVITPSGRYVCEHGRLRSTRATGWDASKFLQDLCATRGVRVSDVCGRSRKRSFAEIRQIFCYVCTVVKGIDKPDVALYINRDRTTVISSACRCGDLMYVDKRFKQRVDDIIAQLCKKSIFLKKVQKNLVVN